jgi:hypothetical protein
MQELEKGIRLNFFPLINKEFTFKIWRRKYQDEKKTGIFQSLYRNTLPIKGNADERDDYWISFEPKQDFEEFICKQNYNHKLTQHLLFYLLCQKIKSSFNERTSYIILEKRFRKALFLVLKEHPQGQETILLEPYYLQPVGKFGFLIDFKFRKKPDIQFSKEIQRLSLSLDANFKSNRNFYIDKYQKLQDFLKSYKTRIFPLVSDGTELEILTAMEELKPNILQTKRYVFGKEATDISQYKGLEKNGPLKKIENKVCLIIVYRKRDEYLVDDLIATLTGRLYSATFKGMKALFGLEFEKIEKIPVSGFEEQELKQAIQKIKSIKTNNKDTLIMPIFIGDKYDEHTYYFMKFCLLKKNLPLQVVTFQLLGRRESLKWSASNIGLQIFAKLGGKPWKVLPSYERSIIFGIGQAHEKSEGKIVKYFAYSVCTDSSGIYKKINVLGKSNDEESYLDQLKGNIVRTIEEHILNGYTKYVLHIPYKIKKTELQTINKAVKQLAESRDLPNTDFIVLKVDPNNKFFGYAYTNSLIPYESTFIRLSSNPAAYLVWFEGLQYHKEAVYKRISGPVYIEFYWTSRDIEEPERNKYLQDVLNLSGANWRGFNAKNVPVSIYYCQLITDFIKRFPGEVENIDKVANPWFL